MCDEASHFMIAHELFRHHENQSRNSTTEEIIHALEVSWIQHYGLPSCLKTDPEGSFRGFNLSLWAQERGIDLVHCPAEAHEQVGDVESLIGKMKTDLRTYLRGKTDLDPFHAVLHMVGAHNTLDRVGGYAPCQWALGRLPNFDGRLFEGGHEVPVYSSQGTPNTEMRRHLDMRVKAEEFYRKPTRRSENHQGYE